MDKQYLTIKEYAEIKGCSKSNVYKQLNTRLKPYVETVKNRKVLKIAVLELLNSGMVENFSTEKVENHSTFSTNNSTNSTIFSTNSTEKVEKVEKDSTQNYNDEIKRINQRNEQIIDDLRNQLKEKDNQIKELTEVITSQSIKISELFENNQQLQLNYQYLLTGGNTPQNEEVNIQSASAEEINETISEPKKKGFFSRFFK